ISSIDMRFHYPVPCWADLSTSLQGEQKRGVVSPAALQYNRSKGAGSTAKTFWGVTWSAPSGLVHGWLLGAGTGGCDAAHPARRGDRPGDGGRGHRRCGGAVSVGAP